MDRNLESASSPGERLDSWKAIAAYLQRDVRTVRRWEKSEGLPVRRHQHGRGATVFAYAAELEAWRARRAGLIREPQHVQPRAPHKRPVLTWATAAIILVTTSAAAVWIATCSPPPSVHIAGGTLHGRLWAHATGEGQRPTWIHVGGQVTGLVITPDGRRVFASDWKSRAIHVIDTAANRVTARVPMPSEPWAIAMSPDGLWTYVGTGGELLRIASRSLIVQTLARDIGTVTDLAFTADGRKLFLTSMYKGLHVLDLPSRALRRLPTVRCPMTVAVAPKRDLLYVGYQCGEPLGRRGHDAIDVRGVASEEAFHTIVGPPQTTEKVLVSPDGTQLWVDGHDACTSEEYDREGCPIVPGGIINLYRTDDHRLLTSLGIPVEEPSGFAFFPDSSRVVVGGLKPQVLDLATLRVVEEGPFPMRASVGFTPSGDRAYLPTIDGASIGVFDLAGDRCVPPPPGMAAWWSGDGSAADLATVNPGAFRNGAAPAPAWVGQGFLFDGVDDHVAVPTLSNIIMNEAFSLALWLKPGRATDDSEVILDNAPSAAGGWKLLNAGGRIVFCHQFSSEPCAGGPWSVQALTPLAAGAWTHVSVVSTVGELRIYINGALDATTPISRRPYAQRQDLRIGGPFGSGTYFAGMLDEIQMFGRAVSPDEVRALNDAGRFGLCVR